MNIISKPEQLPSSSSVLEGHSTISASLAAFAADFSLDEAPSHVVERAKLHILDCFGIALASTTFEFGQRAANALRALGGDGGYPVIGFDMALPVRDQALLNLSLIHI